MRSKRDSATTWRHTLGERLFGGLDARARGNGWQVTSLRGGLRRQYRDPRFDSLAQCGDCLGTGGPADTPCQPCSGTGRVVLRQFAEGKEAR